MTILEMMKELEECDDILVIEYEKKDNNGKLYRITLEDFGGFDENWEEINREYTNPELVDELLKALEAQAAIKAIKDFYDEYFFDDYYIKLGYASYDI